VAVAVVRNQGFFLLIWWFGLSSGWIWVLGIIGRVSPSRGLPLVRTTAIRDVRVWGEVGDYVRLSSGRARATHEEYVMILIFLIRCDTDLGRSLAPGLRFHPLFLSSVL